MFCDTLPISPKKIYFVNDDSPYCPAIAPLGPGRRKGDRPAGRRLKIASAVGRQRCGWRGTAGCAFLCSVLSNRDKRGKYGVWRLCFDAIDLAESFYLDAKARERASTITWGWRSESALWASST